jgi:hypothetical protein
MRFANFGENQRNLRPRKRRFFLRKLPFENVRFFGDFHRNERNFQRKHKILLENSAFVRNEQSRVYFEGEKMFRYFSEEFRKLLQRRSFSFVFSFSRKTQKKLRQKLFQKHHKNDDQQIKLQRKYFQTMLQQIQQHHFRKRRIFKFLQRNLQRRFE